MALPVVLDVDTGVDDACALLLAALHPALDLRAVTCVGGNAPVDAVVANTLTVLDAAARQDVPVCRGAERPLLPARASVEMMYEFTAPFVVDSTRMEREFNLSATPVRSGIERTVSWYADRQSRPGMIAPVRS